MNIRPSRSDSANPSSPNAPVRSESMATLPTNWKSSPIRSNSSDSNSPANLSLGSRGKTRSYVSVTDPTVFVEKKPEKQAEKQPEKQPEKQSEHPSEETKEKKKTSWTKQVFSGRKKVEEKSKIEQTIVENYRLELKWDEEQAKQWIANVLDLTSPEQTKFMDSHSLHEVISDGILLCRLLVTVVPQYAVHKYHGYNNSAFGVGNTMHMSMRIENVNFFRDACVKLGLKSFLFEAADLVKGKNLTAVVACIEQLMKLNQTVWTKATKNLRVKFRAEDGSITEIPVSENTKISDIKQKMAELKSIPPAEMEQYGVFLVKDDLAQSSSEGNNEDMWLDESALLGNFMKAMESSKSGISFRKMRKQVTKLLKVTTNEENLKVIVAASVGNERANDPVLLPGDRIELYFHNISHLHATKAVIGDLYITKYQLIFAVISESPTSLCAKKGFRIPLSSIHSIAKCGGLTAKFGKFYCFELRCKDFHDLKFSYLHLDSKGNPSIKPELRSVNVSTSKIPLSDLLDRHIFPETGSLFAFETSNNAACKVIDGWGIYQIEEEMQRFGLPNIRWRITDMNKDYKYSDSYPSLMVVPSLVTDAELAAVFQFRSKGRIPALVWMNKKTGVPLVRCSQPSVGLTGKRCAEDELLFDSIRLASARDNVYIVDARPQLNAVANQLKGLGYEKEKDYASTKLLFVGIENIHKMSASLKKLRKVCLSELSIEQKAAKIDQTKWLAHINTIFGGVKLIIQKLIREQAPVIVHCSDGWDRTSQLCSLVELIVDPYYRTITGFEVLVEKEWLSFGHRFDQRIGHTNKNHKDEQRSPIFIQFIDAVWQLVKVYPHAFEFNSYFLRIINMHLISCCFGTFLFNSECERRQNHLKERTISLWSHINYHVKDFQNANYEPVQGLLLEEVDFELSIWQDFYCYWYQYHHDIC
eukprot:TRINITY_DN6005_c0_g1_i1.p1 TRINITY_DN6005_c0_g1~~TRINITY_DN6005_c0_g1_i1.p1  ORF type:complete len:927 (+),score=204.47 TRINITY_DN6005_c0_g1_i1:135-2915(+)